jgi:hypothetical protein
LSDLWGARNISLSNYKGKVRDDVCTLWYYHTWWTYYTPESSAGLSDAREVPAVIWNYKLNTASFL